jgi:NitT/TauT family transport system permease protein
MKTVGRTWTGRRRLVIGLQVTVLVVWLGGWELAARTKVIDPFFFSQPSAVWSQILTWTTQGTSQGSLGEQILVTLEEAAMGFVIGVVAGVVAGIALGRIRILADVFAPYIKVANSIPRIVLGSLLIVAFGLGLTSKVLLVIVLVFFGVFFNAFQGTREVDRNLMANAKLLGASRWKVTTEVVMPSAFTWILASLHVSFGFAIIGAIVGEFLGSDRGLGNLIKSAQGNFNQSGVLACMVLTAVFALLAEFLITRLERRLLRWRPPQHGDADLAVL